MRPCESVCEQVCLTLSGFNQPQRTFTCSQGGVEKGSHQVGHLQRSVVMLTHLLILSQLNWIRCTRGHFQFFISTHNKSVHMFFCSYTYKLSLPAAQSHSQAMHKDLLKRMSKNVQILFSKNGLQVNIGLIRHAFYFLSYKVCEKTNQCMSHVQMNPPI